MCVFSLLSVVPPLKSLRKVIFSGNGRSGVTVDSVAIVDWIFELLLGQKLFQFLVCLLEMFINAAEKDISVLCSETEQCECNQGCVSSHVLFRLPVPVCDKRMYDYSFAETVIAVHAFKYLAQFLMLLVTIFLPQSKY